MNTIYAIASKFAGQGIGRTASHAASGLFREGHLKSLVCLGHRPFDIPEGMIIDVPFTPWGLSRLLPEKAFFEVKNQWFDWICQGKLEPGFDTFHCWNSQASKSIQRAKALGVKVVVDRASSHILTQTEILKNQYEKYGVKYNPTYSHVIKRCMVDYELADIVVTPSEFSYKSFADHGFDMSKVVLNPFGVDLAGFSVREKPTDKFQVVFVGQVGIRKGAPLLLKAWDKLKLKDAKLVFVGAIEQAAAPLLSKWQGRSDIEFAGFVDDVNQVLNRSSVFVFPSCEEGSALVVYEAMACGLPVIATFNSGSVVEDGKSGFIVGCDDSDLLANQIEALYKDKEKAWEMGKAARTRVEDFPWEAYGQRTAKLHEGLHAGLDNTAIHKAMGVVLPSPG